LNIIKILICIECGLTKLYIYNNIIMDVEEIIDEIAKKERL